MMMRKNFIVLSVILLAMGGNTYGAQTLKPGQSDISSYIDEILKKTQGSIKRGDLDSAEEALITGLSEKTFSCYNSSLARFLSHRYLKSSNNKFSNCIIEAKNCLKDIETCNEKSDKILSNVTQENLEGADSAFKELEGKEYQGFGTIRKSGQASADFIVKGLGGTEKVQAIIASIRSNPEEAQKKLCKSGSTGTTFRSHGGAFCEDARMFEAILNLCKRFKDFEKSDCYKTGTSKFSHTLENGGHFEEWGTSESEKLLQELSGTISDATQLRSRLDEPELSEQDLEKFRKEPEKEALPTVRTERLHPVQPHQKSKPGEQLSQKNKSQPPIDPKTKTKTLHKNKNENEDQYKLTNEKL